MRKGPPPAPELDLPDPTRESDPAILSTHEHDVGALVAGLIDGELDRRRPLGENAWFRRSLGTPDLRITGSYVNELDYLVIAWRLQQLLRRYEPIAFTDSEGMDAPILTTLDLPEGPVEIPLSVRLAFPADSVMDVPCGVTIRPSSISPRYWIGFAAPRARAGAVDRLQRLLRSDDLGHPYLGLTLEAVAEDSDLDLRIARRPTDQRSDLLLPDEIWREIDENVGSLFANADLLAELDLGLNRGILLTGPPGTGKTHLTRVVAAELAGTATVLFVSPKVMRQDLRRVYRFAEMLAPSLVVLEDVDLAVERRERGRSQSLNDFLVAVDGAMTEHNGIVTIATTNDVEAIDRAAKRAARFDRIIEVPLPPPVGRRRIWERYLRGLDGDFDLDRLVDVTEGGSGADIREIVRRAILATNGQVTMNVLVDGARDRGLGRSVRVGQYL